jgi:hypothetical protein
MTVPRGRWVVELESGPTRVEVVRCEADSTDGHHDCRSDAQSARLERRVRRVFAVAADGLEARRIQFGHERGASRPAAYEGLNPTPEHAWVGGVPTRRPDGRHSSREPQLEATSVWDGLRTRRATARASIPRPNMNAPRTTKKADVVHSRVVKCEVKDHEREDHREEDPQRVHRSPLRECDTCGEGQKQDHRVVDGSRLEDRREICHAAAGYPRGRPVNGRVQGWRLLGRKTTERMGASHHPLWLFLRSASARPTHEERCDRKVRPQRLGRVRIPDGPLAPAQPHGLCSLSGSGVPAWRARCPVCYPRTRPGRHRAILTGCASNLRALLRRRAGVSERAALSGILR